MRLFAALTPPPETLDSLRAAVGRGRDHAPHLRWTTPEEWHITLVFLGEVAGEHLPELEGALGEVARAHRSLELDVQGWGRFPRHSGRSSVLWAGVTGDTDALEALAEGLRAAARGTGTPVEDRPYVPHVTVARSRPVRDLADTVRALGPLRHHRWRAHHVHLMESLRGPGDRYRTVRTWVLG